MLLSYAGQTKIGPGVLEEIIIEGLTKRGMLTEDADVQKLTMEYQNIFGKQTRVHVNSVIVDFLRTPRDID